MLAKTTVIEPAILCTPVMKQNNSSIKIIFNKTKFTQQIY